MTLPLDLQKLPPQALDVIRFLDGKNSGVDVDSILEGTGLSERAFGKAIRRLVTRYYVEMLTQGVYILTANGTQAAQELRVYDGNEPGVPASGEASGPVADRHTRRLTVLVPQELVIRSTMSLRAGFDIPGGKTAALQKTGHVILRVSAPNCDVEPVERPIDVPPDSPAGPVRFGITPRREGSARIKVEVFQLITQQEIELVGGMYFEINVAGFPTPKSAEVQALGAAVGLYPGTEN